MSRTKDDLAGVIKMLDALETGDILVAVSEVLRRRATIFRGEQDQVADYQGYVIADVGYAAPRDVVVEFISFDANMNRRSFGFTEQGKCSTCGILVCSEVKNPSCPLCNTPVECT